MFMESEKMSNTPFDINSTSFKNLQSLQETKHPT